jgi:porphobilinogen synthase
MYPLTRHRRNRKSAWIRDLVSETTLLVSDLIWPVFVVEGSDQEIPIASLPGVSRYSIDVLLRKAHEAFDLGIRAIAIFPVVDKNLKTLEAEESYNPNNLICRAVRLVKKHLPQMGVICDVALDPYTLHGHDGVLDLRTNLVANDKTIDILIHQAIVQVEAGCDIIAPSDMMDGRVLKIRQALEKYGFDGVNILCYSAKYASSFYGPFRDAVGSAVHLGDADKKNYQMDYRNKLEALAEIQSDIEEGADIVMIKPGLPYLDIVSMARQNFNVPIFLYQVSGEYAMLKFAAQHHCFNFEAALLESLTAMKRAGGSAIFTYGALEAAMLLRHLS